MDRGRYIEVVSEALMKLLSDRSSFWSTKDEFAHYARIIREAEFLGKDSKDHLQKALRGWNGDKWDMVEMFVNLFFDKKMQLPDGEDILATLVLYLFFEDKFIAFKNI